MEDAATDCRAVLEKLYVYLDGEMAGGQCAAVEAHLEACAPCFKRLGFERELKLFVQTRCREGAAPESVLRRLREIIERI